MKSPAITISAVEPGLILFLRSSWSNSCAAESKDEISLVISEEFLGILAEFLVISKGSLVMSEESPVI